MGLSESYSHLSLEIDYSAVSCSLLAVLSAALPSAVDPLTAERSKTSRLSLRTIQLGNKAYLHLM